MNSSSGKTTEEFGQNTSIFSINLLGKEEGSSNDYFVSHAKLLAGNEKGVCFSIDGNTLLISSQAYSYLSSGENERIRYQYRIVDSQKNYTNYTTEIFVEGQDDHSLTYKAIRYNDDDDQDSEALTILSPTGVNSQSAAYEPLDKLDSTQETNDEPATTSIDVAIEDVAIEDVAIESVTIEKGAFFTFDLNSFANSNIDIGSNLQKIQIISLPNAGSFLYNNLPVTTGLEVSRADLLTGRLRFTSELTHECIRFQFAVSDGEFYSPPCIFRFSVQSSSS